MNWGNDLFIREIPWCGEMTLAPGGTMPAGQHQDGGATIAGLNSSIADAGAPFGDAVTLV